MSVNALALYGKKGLFSFDLENNLFTSSGGCLELSGYNII
jgi:hypothetical protein